MVPAARLDYQYYYQNYYQYSLTSLLTNLLTTYYLLGTPNSCRPAHTARPLRSSIPSPQTTSSGAISSTSTTAGHCRATPTPPTRRLAPRTGIASTHIASSGVPARVVSCAGHWMAQCSFRSRWGVLHMPCTCHAHAMHMPCIRHAYAMHMPCTYAMHTRHAYPGDDAACRAQGELA